MPPRFFVHKRKHGPMKGFSEIRGQMFRMSFDPISGEFVNVLVPRDIAQASTATVPENTAPENFKPKTISSPKVEQPSAATQTLYKKRA